MRKVLLSSVALILILPAAAAADDLTKETVVVTATRTPQPIDLTGASINVITAKDLETQQLVTVSDALSQTPGSTIIREGGIGQVTTDSIRGAETGQTLVLIDGVRIEDPSLTDSGAILQDLLVNSVDHIEVLRGPQSTLYGSDAIGGVVNILTKRGGDSPFALTATAEGGSFDTAHLNVAANGSWNDLDYGAAANFLVTNSVSAADSRNGNTEPDGYHHFGATANVRWHATDTVSIDLRAYYTRGRDSFDGFPPPTFTFQDDHEFGDDSLLTGYAGVNFSLFDGHFTNRLAILGLSSDRRFFGNFGFLPPFAFDTSENFFGKGGTSRFEYQGVYDLGDEGATQFTFGAESQLTTLATHSVFDLSPTPTHGHSLIQGYYAQGQTTLLDQLTLIGGVRFDHDEEFGDHTSWKMNAAWRPFDWGTILRGSYATGFKAPSLFEQFSEFSNPIAPLKPETAHGWEIGLDQYLFDDRVRASLTYFDRRTNNLIDFFDCFGIVSPACTARAFAGGFYINVGQTEATGTELSVTAQVLDTLALSATYTNMATKDLASGLPLARRPDNAANAVLTWTPNADVTLGGSVGYVGTRFNDSFASVPLSDYVLFNLFGSYRLCEQFDVYARVDNLLDKHYEPVAGFGAPTRAFYAGVRAHI
jgi:vitamin B12 transporter